MNRDRFETGFQFHRQFSVFHGNPVILAVHHTQDPAAGNRESNAPGKTAPEGVDHSQCFTAFRTADCLPAFRMPPAFRYFPVESGNPVSDDPSHLPEEGNPFIDLCPLLRRKFMDVAGQAHHAQESVDQGIIDPPDTVFRPQRRPDLALCRQDQPVKPGGNDRNLRALMCVGEGSHIGNTHQGRLQPVSAGRAVFDPDLRDLFPQAAEESQRSLHILPQALAKAIRVIASGSDTVVIVDLCIPEAAFLQQADYPLVQISLYLRHAHVQETAVIRVDHRSVPFQQHLFPPEDLRAPGTRFRFKPQSGNHSMIADHIRGSLQALREHFCFLRNPVAAAVGPAFSLPPVPSRIDHQEFDPAALQAVSDLFQVLMGRISPGCAVFIEHHRQLRIRPWHVCPMDRQQPLADPVHAPAAHGYICLGRLKAFSRRDRLCPVPEVLIRQGRHHVQTVILPADFHLPGRRTGQLHRPGHIIRRIFDRSKGEPSANGHRTDLAELHDPQGMACPGPLQHGLLNRPGNQPSLCAPRASGLVKQQRTMGVTLRERGNPAQVQAGEQIQRQRFSRPVLKADGNPQRFPSFLRTKNVKDCAAGFIRQLSYDSFPFIFLAHKAKRVCRRGNGHRVAVTITVWQMIPPCMNLYQWFQGMIMCLHPVFHLRRDQGHTHMAVVIQPPGHQHVAEYVFTELFHRSVPPLSVRTAAAASLPQVPAAVLFRKMVLS